MKSNIFLLIISTILFTSSCKQKERKDESRIPHIEVGGRYLYMDELQAIVPKGSLKKDSIALINDYEKKWITQVLMLNHAENNISNPEEIEELVEDYRESLIIHQYQQNLVMSKLGQGPSEDEILEFYNANKEQFRLTNNWIKGVYIKMPIGSPKADHVSRWFKNFDQKSLENMEKYSLQNATSYEYFGDNWVLFNEIAKNLPFKIEDPVHFIKSYKYLETKDSSFLYFMKILDSRVLGDIEPYDIAKDKIKIILINKQKNDFIRTFENNLYDEAIKEKQIRYFKNEEQQ